MSHNPDERDNPYEPVEPPEGTVPQQPADAPADGDLPIDANDATTGPDEGGVPFGDDDASPRPDDGGASTFGGGGTPTAAADVPTRPGESGVSTFGDDAPTRADDGGTPAAADDRDVEDTWTDTAPVPAPAADEPPVRTSVTDPDTAVTSTFDVREAERRQAAGVHEAERPVPRSGLAEHNSAGYLTGERHPVDPDAPAEDTRAHGDAASPAWLGATGAGAGAAGSATPAPADAPADRTRRDVVLDGTTAVTRPPSRGGAHVLTVLVTLLLTPVAWYLLADAGARLTLARNSPWDSGDLNVAALLELAGGLLVLAVVLLAARWSSLGAIVTGIVVLIVGVPFLAVPRWTQETLEPVVSWLERLDDFGGNVAHHLVASGSTGRLVVAGLALVLVGVVSHGARRQGRREVRPAVETD